MDGFIKRHAVLLFLSVETLFFGSGANGDVIGGAYSDAHFLGPKTITVLYTRVGVYIEDTDKKNILYIYVYTKKTEAMCMCILKNDEFHKNTEVITIIQRCLKKKEKVLG